MKFVEILNKIRYLIRDEIDMLVSNSEIMNYWNQSQVSLFSNISPLSTVNNYTWPPRYDYAYMFDWERGLLDGDGYQMKPSQSSGRVNTYDGETSHWVENSISSSSFYTQPYMIQFMSNYECPPIPLHVNFLGTKLVAFDKDILMPELESNLVASDPNYKTRTGQAYCYYRSDVQSNEFFMYPIPPVTNFDDYDVETESFDAEEPSGVVIYEEEELDFQDLGVIIDSIQEDGNIIFVYDYLPYSIISIYDEIEFPEWLVPFVMYDCIERIYRNHIQEFAGSKLAQYWESVKKYSILVLETYKRVRIKTDRRIQLKNNTRKDSIKPAMARMDPSHYRNRR